MLTRKRIFFLSVGIVVLAGLFLWIRPSRPIVQPLSFNHKVHLTPDPAKPDVKPLECTDCHQFVRQRAAAGRPSLETCAKCHEGTQPKTESLRKLKGYMDRKEEVPWKRIYRVPDYVYFSHQRHVVAGDLSCQTCHGNVEQFTEPVPRPVVDLTMDTCISCHTQTQTQTQKKVTTDCNACHR